MGRVINLNNNAKERTQLSRSIVLALRELSKQSTVNEKTRDLAAYIALALETIMQSVESSVVAWEKRGYWLKADRYRMEWIWTKNYSDKLRVALKDENWQQVALLSAQITENLQSINLPQRHRLGTPWVGAWKRLQDLESGSASTTSTITA